jgi:hypothetical protein
VQERGLAAARRSDDRDEAPAAGPEARLQQLEQMVDLVVAPEEHGGVFGRERAQARVRRAGRVPGERVGRVESRAAQAGEQSRDCDVALGQVDPLDVVEQRHLHAAPHPHREHGLAQRAREGHLREAPAGRDRGRARQEDHGIAAPELRVQLALPGATCGDPALGVGVEEERDEPRMLQALEQPRGNVVVTAGVAQKERGHGDRGAGLTARAA